MIHCKNMVKFYGQQRVLDDLSFELREGEILGLLGPNGAGKTTTIKLILDLIKLDGGEIDKDEDMLIGYSPETPYFHTFLSAYEVMKFYGKLQHMKKEELNNEIIDCLELVGLSKDKDKKVGTFSKGMLQRLAVAQSLLGNPSVVVLDEPSAGLDAVGRVGMRKLILKLKEEGKTVLLNSHILSDVQSVADRVIIIDHGKMIQEIDLHEKNQKEELETIFLNAVEGVFL